MTKLSDALEKDNDERPDLRVRRRDRRPRGAALRHRHGSRRRGDQGRRQGHQAGRSGRARARHRQGGRRAVAARHARGAGDDARRGRQEARRLPREERRRQVGAAGSRRARCSPRGERKARRPRSRVAADGDDGLPVAMIDRGGPARRRRRARRSVRALRQGAREVEGSSARDARQVIARAESIVQAERRDRRSQRQARQELRPARHRVSRSRAVARASTGIEDYTTAAEALTKAAAQRIRRVEPRFWARVAWAHYTRGDLKRPPRVARARSPGTARARPRTIRRCSSSTPASRSPPGLPDKALDVASKLEGVRPRLLRAYAELDLGKPKDALDRG